MSLSIMDLPDEMLCNVFARAENIVDIRLVCKRFEVLATSLVRTVYLNNMGHILTKDSVDEDFSFFSRVGNDQTTVDGEDLSPFALACIGHHLSRFKRVDFSVGEDNYSEEFFEALFAQLSTRLEVLRIHFESGWTRFETVFEDTLTSWLDTFIRSRSATLHEVSLLNRHPEEDLGLPFFVHLYSALKTCAQLTHLAVSFWGYVPCEFELTRDAIRALPNLTSLNVHFRDENDSAQLVLAFLQSARAPHAIHVGASNPILELSKLVDPACSFPSVRRLAGVPAGRAQQGYAAVAMRLFPGLEHFDTTVWYEDGEQLPPALKSVAIQCYEEDVEGIVSQMPPQLEEMMLSTVQASTDLRNARPLMLVGQHLRRLTLQLPHRVSPCGVLASLSELPELVYLQLVFEQLASLDFGPFPAIPSLQTLQVSCSDDPYWDDDDQLDLAGLSRAYPSLTTLHIPLNPLAPIAPFEPLLKLREFTTVEFPNNPLSHRALFAGMPDLRLLESSLAELSDALLRSLSSSCPRSVRAILFGDSYPGFGAPRVHLSSVVMLLKRLPRLGRLQLPCRLKLPAHWEADFRALVGRMSLFGFMGSNRERNCARRVRSAYCNIDVRTDDSESDESDSDSSADTDHSDSGSNSYPDGEDSEPSAANECESDTETSESDSKPHAKRVHLDC